MGIKKTIIFIVLTMSTHAIAQYELNKITINNGGESMTSNSYQVSGSIGQVDANSKQIGANYTLNAGFWNNSNSAPLTEAIFSNGFE